MIWGLFHVFFNNVAVSVREYFADLNKFWEAGIPAIVKMEHGKIAIAHFVMASTRLIKNAGTAVAIRKNRFVNLEVHLLRSDS